MSNATAIPNAYVPISKEWIEGRFWLRFSVNDITFETYNEMPNALRYDNLTFIKAGWNSDLNIVNYKEGKIASAM